MKNSLLLHVCCAECLNKAVDSLRNDDGQQFDHDEVTLYFDNSNIHPRTEWVARLEAVKTVAETYKMKLIVADWSPKKWFSAIECKPDNKSLRRCSLCWEMRIKAAKRKAVEIGADHFTTTLLTSRYQNKKKIIRIGNSVQNESTSFVTFPVRTAKRRRPPIYLQNYCGCCYSLTERYTEKYCK